jgi:hypothetical protein
VAIPFWQLTDNNLIVCSGVMKKMISTSSLSLFTPFSFKKFEGSEKLTSTFSLSTLQRSSVVLMYFVVVKFAIATDAEAIKRIEKMIVLSVFMAIKF